MEHILGKENRNVLINRWDVILNFISIGLLGVSGLALNLGIGYFYDASTLGVFNQVMAIYVVFSQFSTLGLQLSILHLAGKTEKFSDEVFKSVFSGHLKLLLLFALLTSLLLVFTSSFWARVLESEGIRQGCLWIAPGILFFSLNKFLLGYANGKGKMRVYAYFQAQRYLGILLILAGFFVYKWSGDYLPFVFTGSEFLLSLSLCYYYRSYLLDAIPKKFHLKENIVHIKFGLQSMTSGALLEFNSRVDILLIGFFMTDNAAGLYSFAALFIEGASQFLIVLQNIFNPPLSKLLYALKFNEYSHQVKRTAVRIYILAFGILISACLIYPDALQLIGVGDKFHASWSVFCILLSGLFFASGLFPFHTLFVMMGKPVVQSLFMAFVVGINVVLNLIFIPIWGINGAAAATAIATGSTAILFLFLNKKYLVNI